MSFLNAGKLWTTETRSYSSSIFFSSCSHLDFFVAIGIMPPSMIHCGFPQRGVLMTTAATDLAESLLGQAMADIPAGEVNVSPEIVVQWSASRKKCLVVPGDEGGRRPIDMIAQKQKKTTFTERLRKTSILARTLQVRRTNTLKREKQLRDD